MAITRVATLRKVFKSGQSELLNEIARLAILYEDLRLEMTDVSRLYDQVIEFGESGYDHRVLYFLRRALATLVEFRGALTNVRKSGEFKVEEPELTPDDARLIAEADKYLAANWDLIKGLRNQFAGHIQLDGVKFAVTHLTNEVGNVTWNPKSDDWTIGIECDFATTLLVGVIGSALKPDRDFMTEFRKAVQTLSEGFNHAQAATMALVHAFLWNRFGR